jgi:uncharacterized protein
VRALILLLFVTLVACSSCSSGPELTHEEAIAAWHAEKDAFMREAEDSPVPKDKRAGFPALTYFSTNGDYRVPAALTVERSDKYIELPTSTGQRRRMQRIGSLDFTLKGEPFKLSAFAEDGDRDLRRLFVPFGDRTNGTETYPAGRYIDLERTATSIYELDFNRAYHPFCLYNPTYDCPIPPRENRLATPIRAGEKLGAAGQ